MNSSYQDGKGFDKLDPESIIVHIHTFQKGDELFISRSQAKSILSNLEQYKFIILDFAEVPFAGRAFIDEIFRVYRNDHPEVEMQFVNANREIGKLIEMNQRENEI